MNELLAQFLHGYAATNDWSAIMPEILLAVLALGLLAAEMFLSKARQSLIPRIAIWGQVFVGVYAFSCISGCTLTRGSFFSGMIEQTDLTQIMRAFFLLSSILVCYLGHIYLSRQLLVKTEFYHLVILIAAGMMLLVQSSNFVMLFVALETVTVAFYVLVGYCRNSSLSLESGLKYLIMGALSSSILLFGIVLLYGVAGNSGLPGSTQDALNFAELQSFIAMNQSAGGNLIVNIGSLLVIAGICFKIGAVPFQIWVPDVYQGAPTPVTAYLAVASKAAGFIVLVTLVTGPFAALNDLLVPVLSVIAAATILFGNIAAVTQRNIKRLLGLSGVAHAGYLLLGVIAVMLGIGWAVYAIIFYLVTYLLASFAVFGVMSLSSDADDANQEIDHYSNYSRKHPYLSAVLAVGLGSLAGIPPLGGFIGKLFLFVAAYQAGLYGLLGISILGVAISIYYYFGWIRECYFSSQTTEVVDNIQDQTNSADRLLLGGLVFATVCLGLLPGILPIVP
ncbi:MAG: NADH-quinone oxidoreductase subunit N [Opitutales bacterium]